jgi:polyferredoxin
MSCGSGNCGCGGKGHQPVQPPENETPVTAYIRTEKNKTSGSVPDPRNAFARAISWFVKTIIADMRITRVRVLSQTFFFTLFLFFVVITDLRYLKGYPVSLFLELDPLVGVATAITTGTVYKALILGLILLLPTLLLGRFFCNWICPYGTLHQLTNFLFGSRDEQKRIESNRFSNLQQLKYVIWLAMIVAAIFGSLQIGLLDPICLFHRSMSVAILPGINLVFPDTFYVEQYFHVGAWLVGGILFFFVGMNVIIPRFFCRAVCPLGAFLGVLSRFSVMRIERDPNKCIDCDACLKNCQGASDPHTQLRKSECFVCFECIEDCPVDAISFSFMPNKDHEVAGPPLPGRRAALASILGVAGFAVARASGDSDANFSKKVIRPPGSVAEEGFLERCIKCDQCIRVCPTNVLRSATASSTAPFAGKFARPAPSSASPLRKRTAAASLRNRDRSSSGPPSTTMAAASPGPWRPPASFARRSVRLPRKPFTRMKSPSRNVTAAWRPCGVPMSIRPSASDAGSASMNAPSRTMPPYVSPPSGRPGRPTAGSSWTGATPPICSISRRASVNPISMSRKEIKLQPATRDKKCQVCGADYIYPEKDSKATRFHCELCAGLPTHYRKILTRMGKRIQSLERKLK